MREFFARLDEKHKFLGNFEKTLKFCEENKIEKLNFYLIFENLLLKIKTSEISSFFLQQFFRFRGGRNFPSSPLTTPRSECNYGYFKLEISQGIPYTMLNVSYFIL